MADKKISQLSSAATPLAGTEILPIVQSSSTVKVAVSDLTAGRNVAVGATVSLPRTLSVGGSVALERFNATPQIAIRGGTDSTTGLEYRFSLTQTNGLYISNAVIGGSQLENWFFRTNGDFTVNTGNLVIGTAGKGIDFSATAGTGTSELFDDYEEGEWTPVFSDAASGGNVSPSQAALVGRYTKIGNLVVCRFRVLNINTTGMTAGNDFFIQGFPFLSEGTTYNDTVGVVATERITFTGAVALELPRNETYARLVEYASNADDDYIMVSEVASNLADIIATISYTVA